MAKSLKDLYTDKDYNVPFVEKPAKQENIVNSELNKNRPLLQLTRNLPRAYGTDLPRIESAGTIDIARTAAVRGARYNDPNKPAGLGLNLGNLLGGSANRPSDTIFESKTSAPVSKGTQPVNGDWSALKYAVEEDTDYLISKAPMKDNFLTGLFKGPPNAKDLANNAIGKVQQLATDAIRKGINKALTGNRKKAKKPKETPAFEYDNEYISSEYMKTVRLVIDDYTQEAYTLDMMTKRSDMKITSFNGMRDDVLTKEIFKKEEYEKLISKHIKTGITYITFKMEDGNYLVLPAAFSGDIAETITSDWSDFKYVGSPFKNYRYLGVSRDLKISFDVYWLNVQQQSVMQSKLNMLRGFAFPNKNLATIQLGNDKYSPLAFSPNIFEFSLGDYYKNLKVIVGGVSIGVPQRISWGSTNSDFVDNKSIVYPTVVNVSMDMKIIETPDIAADGKTITYRLDDMNEPTAEKVDKESDIEKWTKARKLPGFK